MSSVIIARASAGRIALMIFIAAAGVACGHPASTSTFSPTTIATGSPGLTTAPTGSLAPSPDPTGTTSVSTSTLAGALEGTWVLEGLSIDGEVIPLEGLGTTTNPEVPGWIEFLTAEDDQSWVDLGDHAGRVLVGQLPCNGFHAAWQVSGDALELPVGLSEAAGCDADTGNQLRGLTVENATFAALGSGPLEVALPDEDTLELTAPDAPEGVTVLTWDRR